jgi:hypothetical protein
VVEESLRPPRPTDISVRRGLDDSLWGLVERCWAKDPKDRPTATTVAAQIPSSCPIRGVVDHLTRKTHADSNAPALSPPHHLEKDLINNGPLSDDCHPAHATLVNDTWQFLAECEELDVNGLMGSVYQSFETLQSWYTGKQYVNVLKCGVRFAPYTIILLEKVTPLWSRQHAKLFNSQRSTLTRSWEASRWQKQAVSLLEKRNYLENAWQLHRSTRRISVICRPQCLN